MDKECCCLGDCLHQYAHQIGFNSLEELEERYKQSSAPKIYQIRNDLANLKQNDDCVVIYYNKLKVLWDELDGFLDRTTYLQSM